jgi:phage tail sheath gpL-like
MKLSNNTINKTKGILKERMAVKENFTRMDALQGSNEMETAFAAVNLETLTRIAMPYLDEEEKGILKDELLKIVMLIPDAELEDIYDEVVANIKK